MKEKKKLSLEQVYSFTCRQVKHAPSQASFVPCCTTPQVLTLFRTPSLQYSNLYISSTLTLASPSPAKVKDFPLEIRAKTCAGTPLTCGPTPFATSYVTSGKVVITTVITTTYVNPVTLPTTVMVPKSCHTFLLPVPQSDNDFCGPFTSKCGPAPACIVETTVTGLSAFSLLHVSVFENPQSSLFFIACLD